MKRVLQKAKNPEQAEILQGLFNTGKGEYGEVDVFLGIKVPVQRKIAKKYFNLSLKEITLQKILSDLCFSLFENNIKTIFIINIIIAYWLQTRSC